MELITLKFPSILELIDFSIASKLQKFEINRLKNTLTGKFPPEDIDYAIKGFKAIVVDVPARRICQELAFDPHQYFTKLRFDL